jgi:hypothetical protein
MSTRSRRFFLLALPIVVLSLRAPAPAAAPDPRAQAAAAVVKAVAPWVKKVLFDTKTGQATQVRALPALAESKLVVARKALEVRTEHWESSRALGKATLTSTVPCEVFYCVDSTRLRCYYHPKKKVLQVSWPGAQVLTVTPDLTRQKAEFKGTLRRRLSLGQPETRRRLEGEVPAALKRVSWEEARKHTKEVDREVRAELRRLFRELAREVDRDIEVKID